MTRLCPSGSPCPSQRCRHHLSGGRCTLDIERPYTQAEVAAELGISERSAQRLEELSKAWLELALCRAIRREIGDLDSEESRVMTGGSKIACRVPRNRPDD